MSMTSVSTRIKVRTMSSLSDFFVYDFLYLSVIVSFLMAIMMGILSPIIVVKKYAFIGSGISHSTLLGLAIGSAFSLTDSPLQFFLVTSGVTLIISMILAKFSYDNKLPTDTLIGIFFTTAMSTGLILQFHSPESRGSLFDYLVGNLLLVEKFDILCFLVLVLLSLFHFLKNFRSWISFCWNEQQARINNVPTKIYHYGLFAVITLSIVIGLKLAGIILVSSYLIIPGAFALRVSRKSHWIFINSVLFAQFTSIIALYFANLTNSPVGPIIALIQAFVFLLTFSFKVR